MSEQESNIPNTEDEDVEAHSRSKRTTAASDEPRDDAETEGDDDVELHGKRKAM
ncbi:MAG: hypothetical protein H0V45_12735 [Actinobacteria bacterium]|nr:hypothetical protein [Actinomycetota bacterium]